LEADLSQLRGVLSFNQSATGRRTQGGVSKKEAVIVAGVRTAVGKAPRGTLRTTRPDDMAATVIKDLLRRIPELSPESIDDVILGCATPEGESGANVARIAALRAGLPHSVPAVTVNRFCSSGLQSVAMAAHEVLMAGDG
jgi:acetyl-CoA acyltransferase